MLSKLGAGLAHPKKAVHMKKLGEIDPGQSLSGIEPRQMVTVVAVDLFQREPVNERWAIVGRGGEGQASPANMRRIF
ncbi:hypothetical protein [Paracoccus sp. DMF]|uniref:hypothetical protein n=1 Tax=Paracoccus sp. DMF TaxID=400837 RepID=UPI0021E3DCB7|nr:hypothetical protein [Paracoccus sp. DMF]MCV2448570.1 hypothetical protein [Paracoccus sp. DMF]